MKLKIKRKVVTVEERIIDVTLKKSAEDIYLMVGPLYIFSIKNDGTGKLFGGLEDNNFNLQTEKTGRLKMEKN